VIKDLSKETLSQVFNSPAYLKVNDFKDRIHQLQSLLSPCILCPRKCGVNRMQGKTGMCRSGLKPKIASYNIHNGEEPPVSGPRGSGTIFFSGCGLRCIFCQNFPISQLLNGNEVSVEEVAGYMLFLQKKGAHNINFVTPTHYVPQIVEAVYIASQRGLKLPLVYNSSGYEELQTLKLLDGIIDIYLPDMKYSSDENALKYSGVNNYVEINRLAIKEIYRQVGPLTTDEHGIARRGLIIRHLVLPGDISGTEDVLRFICELDPAIPVSLMSQYFPAHRANNFPELKRHLKREEYTRMLHLLEKYMLENGWVQPL